MNSAVQVKLVSQLDIDLSKFAVAIYRPVCRLFEETDEVFDFVFSEFECGSLFLHNSIDDLIFNETRQLS